MSLVQTEFVDIVDPDKPGWKWRFEIPFLLSGYECIFGNGCECPQTAESQGTGCCEEGVFLEDDDGDDGTEFARVAEKVAQLTDEDWQMREVFDEHWWTRRRDRPTFAELAADPRGIPRRLWTWGRGLKHTETTRGACVFANRPGEHESPGCAFHVAAVRRGENYVDWKPYVCWLVPLQMQIDEVDQLFRVTHYRNYEDWGGGEEELQDWWCTDAQKAYRNPSPFFKRERDVLRALAGEKVEAELYAYLERRWVDQAGWVADNTPVNWKGYEGFETRLADGSTGFPLPQLDP